MRERTVHGASFADRRFTRREWLALGAGVGVAAAVAACAPAGGPPAPGGAPAPAGAPGAAPKKLAESVIFGSQIIGTSVDPHVYVTGGFPVHRQIYDALVGFDDKGEKIIPQLAAEWKRIDPLTMEFKLRDDVKFSNGEPFTAETVKFNVERMQASKDPLGGSFRRRQETLASAEVVNNTTVRIKTKTADPILLNRLTVFWMGPKKYLESGEDPSVKPVGTGSLKVVGYDRNKQVLFEAWDGSWRGKSTIKSAKIVAISELAALISALKTGEIDIAHNVQGDQAAGLRGSFNVDAQPAGELSNAVLLPMAPAFRDKRVRQAVNYAVNKEELVKTVLAGFGRVAQGQAAEPFMPGYDDSIKAYPYDPEKAKSLLREAGFPSVDVTAGTDVQRKGVSEASAGYLKAVGINVSIRVLEGANYTLNLLQKSEHPIFFWASQYFHLRDVDASFGRFVDDPARESWFENAEFQRLTLALRTELDMEKRVQMSKQAAKIMYEEAPCLFLFWQDFAVVYTKKIAKLALPYDTTVHLWKVEKEAS